MISKILVPTDGPKTAPKIAKYATATLIIFSFFHLVAAYAFAYGDSAVHEPQQHRHTEYSKIKNAIPMTEQSVSKGREIYEKHCIACHGESGRGGIGVNLADESWLHGGNDGEIFHSITDGIKGTQMKGFKKELTKESRWHLVNYIKSLRKGEGKVGK